MPQSVVWHLGGGTLPAESPWKLYLNYRNNILLLENNLGRTIGRRSAALRILIRKGLDLCSALVYLICGKIEYSKAVLRAHRDARELVAASSPYGPENNLTGSRPGQHKVCGIYSKCMIPRALIGSKIDTENI